MKNKKIIDYLFDTGISSKNKGFRYLYEAIEIVIDNECVLPPLVKELYPAIAKKHNERWGAVERCMRASIRTSSKPEIKYAKLGEYISKAAIIVAVG